MRLKTLNGAPLPHRLDFSDASLLGVDDCGSFEAPREFLGHDSSVVSSKWRCLVTPGTRMPSGWSQPHLPESDSHGEHDDINNILSGVVQPTACSEAATTEPDTTFDPDDSAAEDFLKHSIIFHDTLLSSQVLQDADQTISSSSFLSTSFGTSMSEKSVPSRFDEHAVDFQVPSKTTVTPLGSLPNAQQLRSIYPQTPTPNLLCVLMVEPEQREVCVRRSGHKMMLCEIIVGDDTQSGFKVTFWLRPQQDSNNEQVKVQNDFNQTLDSIRIGDILLLRNIALTSFRGIVHGQSLNPTIARARTTIDILTKNDGTTDRRMSELPVNIGDAVTRVKRWARKHIVTSDSKKRRANVTTRAHATKRVHVRDDNDEDLPPDTMEAI